MSDRVAALRSLGCATVIPFGPLSGDIRMVCCPHYAVDLPHQVVEQSTTVPRRFDLWADEASRRECIAQLRWRLSFDFDEMAPPTAETIYFRRT